MKISNIIFCGNAINVEGEGVKAEHIFSSLTPNYIPGLFSFSVIAIILGIDSNVEHDILIEFCSPEDEKLVVVCGKSPKLENTTNLPAEHKGLNIATNWQDVNFKTSGLYTLKITVDKEYVGAKEIYVKGLNE